MSLWQRMPAHLIESQILVSGGAFKMKYRFGSEEPKPHFFFILKNPVRDNYLFMVTATTEIRRRKKRFCHDREALVVITHSEYSDLPETSLVDCGSPIVELKANIIAKISQYEAQPLYKISDSLLERLRNAVVLSKRLTSNQKRLVLGEEETIDLPPSAPAESQFIDGDKQTSDS